MMSLETPQMSRKHLLGFFIFVYGAGTPYAKYTKRMKRI